MASADADDAFVSVADSLARDIVGQPRTKKHFTFLRGRYAYKGPIDGKRLETMQTRPGWLAYWGTPLVVLPLEQLATGDGVFLKFENLLAGEALESEPYTERTTGIAYRVLVRSGLVKMRALFDNTVLRDATYASFGHALLLAFVHLYILGAGDVGPHNVLARLSADGARVVALHVIDVEDSRMAELDAPEFFLSKRQPAWYGLARLRPLYARVAREVEALLADKANEPHAERVRLAVANLRKHDPLPTPAPSFAPAKRAAPAAAAVVAKKAKVAPSMPASKAVPVAVTEAATTTTTTTTAAALSVPDVAASASRATFKGMRGGGTTHSGIALDVAKSALQKHVRRGETTRALVMATELWRMVELEGARPVQSNLYNRLATIAVEDIGVSDLPLCAVVIEYVCGWGATGTKSMPPDRSLHYLAAIVRQLAESRKTRVMSHLWRAYAVTEGTALARQRGVRVDEAAAAAALTEAEVRTAWAPHAVPGDPPALCALAVMFARRLGARDRNAVFWAARFLDAAKGVHAGRRGGRTVASAMLWSVLATHVAPDVCNALALGFYTFSEPRPFVMAAITAVLYGVARPPRRVAELSAQLRTEADAWRARPMLAKLREGRYAAPVVDAHAVDVHTARGRSGGKTRHEFVREGAHVENEDARFADAALRAIYEES